MAERQAPRGLLFDLDGVLYVGERAIPGASQALEQLRERKLPCRFITNTSTRPASAVGEKLRHMGFSVDDSEIFSAVSATHRFLSSHGSPSVDLLVGEEVRPEFADFPRDGERPDFVVVGDIGAAWDYALLNRVFNELMNGARLIAMHKNRYWQTAEGLRMDIGAFVTGLEYVSGKEATIIGKPSPDFFRLATDSLGLAPEEIVIVGDDIENDIGGGRNAGLQGWLVRTGKYREDTVQRSGIRPDAVLDSIADVPGLLL